jgi:VCBS repeat-containing protein
VLLTEDFASITGSFATNDPDNGQNPDFSGQTIVGEFGTFIISDNGTTFTYILNPGLADSTEDRTETILPEGASNSFSFTIEARTEDNVADTGAAYTLVADGPAAFFGRGNEFITGSSAGDRIDTGAGNDRVNGGSGNDTITDPFGNDTLSGGAGNDNITALSGTNEIDDADGLPGDSNYFKGGVGRDTITGGAGNDFLDGDYASSLIGAGDTLDGGAGNDYLRGGLGADVFIFREGSGNDKIADFDIEVGDGTFTLVESSLRRDFTVGLDKVDISAFGVSDLTGFTVSNESDGAVIDFGNGDTLTFVGLTAAQITADSFIF